MTGPINLQDLQEYCDKKGIPGPKVVEHDEDYEGECFCQMCLEYGA